MSKQEVDRLFELPPEEFTAARNELARKLKDDGDASAAADVKQLSKPSVATWAINQLAREQQGAVKLLLESAARLKKAQENALKGGGTGDALRRAQADERKALRELTQQAQGILERSGRSAGSTVRDKIASTLRAAAVDDAGRVALKAGRLTGEVKSSGFDVFAGLELPAKASRRSAPAKDDERRRKKDERESKLQELEKRARELTARAKEEAKKAELAETEAGKARRAADKSRREADDAAAELDAFDP
jgi:hypothetical protein